MEQSSYIKHSNLTICKNVQDSEGNRKLAVTLADGEVIETVLLHDKNGRNTACLSTQVGCKMACRFCMTGRIGFKRNLSPSEILGQFDLLEKEVGASNINNVVFMGMGEPLLNFENLIESIRILTEPKERNIFLKNILVSTSGIPDGIKLLAASSPVPGLAVSLVTADEQLRKQLMPIASKTSLQALKTAMLEYQRLSRKRIIIEIVLFKGLNDNRQSAEKILRYVDGLKAMINLIPFNNVTDTTFKAPSPDEVKEFSQIFLKNGVPTTIRFGRGTDIAGACGQLGTEIRRGF